MARHFIRPISSCMFVGGLYLPTCVAAENQVLLNVPHNYLDLMNEEAPKGQTSTRPKA